MWYGYIYTIYIYTIYNIYIYIVLCVSNVFVFMSTDGDIPCIPMWSFIIQNSFEKNSDLHVIDLPAETTQFYHMTHMLMVTLQKSQQVAKANHEGANHVFFPCEVPGRKKRHGWVHDPSAGGCFCDIWESRWSPRRWCCYHKWMAMSQQVQHCLGNQHCPMKGWPYSKVEPPNFETSSSTSPKFMAVTVSGKWKTERKHRVYSIDGQISVAKWDY